MQSITNIQFKMMDGTLTTISKSFPGKTVLIVNVASRCGLTPQLQSLEKLHQEFRGLGLEILGVPCNQFAEQAPESDMEFAHFCRSTYATTFALTEKIEVNGMGAHPLYQALKLFPTGVAQDIDWNFEKFLLDQNGNVVARFDPRLDPLNEDLVALVARLLESPV